MRAQIAALACAAALGARTADAAIAEHRVAALPGWAGPLPSAIYSGYITVQPTGATCTSSSSPSARRRPTR